LLYVFFEAFFANSQPAVLEVKFHVISPQTPLQPRSQWRTIGRSAARRRITRLAPAPAAAARRCPLVRSAWKYRCHGCSRLTCSLPCVQAHKRRTTCTGKRSRTEPVPIARFDDNQLLSGTLRTPTFLPLPRLYKQSNRLAVTSIAAFFYV
jgi:hypothetical protein